MSVEPPPGLTSADDVLTRNITFIHIGKSGGTTLHSALDKAVRGRLHLRHYHTYEGSGRPPRLDYEPSRLFVINIRNPIRRFISAFYFQRWAAVDSPVHEQRRRFYARYPSASEFAEALYAVDDVDGSSLNATAVQSFPSNNHIRCNINWYLSRFLPTIPPGALEVHRNVVVVTLELMKHDAAAGLGIAIRNKLNRNAGASCKLLSERALANLRRFLAPDYAAVERLQALGLLTPAQYAVLSDPVCTQDAEWCGRGAPTVCSY